MELLGELLGVQSADDERWYATANRGLCPIDGRTIFSEGEEARVGIAVAASHPIGHSDEYLLGHGMDLDVLRPCARRPADQVRGEEGDLVGIEVLGSADDLVFLHLPEQMVARGVRKLKQDGAAPIRPDQSPYSLAPVQRESLKHKSQIGRMELIEPFLELNQLLLGDDGLNEILLLR